MDRIRKVKQQMLRWQEHRAFFPLALILLNVLLLLPVVLLHPMENRLLPVPPFHSPRGWYDVLLFFFRRVNVDVLRLSADYIILLTLLLIAARTRWYKVTGWIVAIVYLFLLIFQIYDAATFLIFGQHPILYNDLKLLLGAFYLVVDLSFSRLFLAVSGTVLLILLTIGFIIFLFQGIFRKIGALPVRHPFTFLLILAYPLVIGLTYWFGFTSHKPAVWWITPRLVNNLKESVTLYRYLHSPVNEKPDSTYFHYGNLHLKSPPNISLFMLESYGKILARHPHTRQPYREMMQRFEEQLTDAGWHCATNYSQAPISGGLSWLSIATVLCGIKIKDQALYSYMLSNVKNYPHLPKILRELGYTTFNLQPMNRQRPGFSLKTYDDFYRYDKPIFFLDLDYRAGDFGFGFIPDQYSLYYAHEKFLKNAPRPYFLFFITTISHYPWLEIPPFVTDWQKLRNQTTDYADSGGIAGKLNYTYRIRFMSEEHFLRYLKSIEYTFRVMVDYIIHHAPEHSLIILLGDHQPPIITGAESSFQTPMHIISQDSNLVVSWLAHGFVPGLLKPASAGNTLKHQGIYSLLMQILVRNYGTKADSIRVPYQPQGIPFSIIRKGEPLRQNSQ